MYALEFIALFALLQNIDNLVLAAAYRLKDVAITWPSNLVIAGMSGIATGAGVALAQAVKLNVGEFGLGSAAEVIGRGILVMIGSWTLVCYFRVKLFSNINAPVLKNRPSVSNEGAGASDSGKPMTIAEAIVSGTALAVDNLAPSFAFGLVNPARQSLIEAGATLAILTAAFSVVSVYVGQAIGAEGRSRLRWISPEVASGCLIISIGILDYGDVQHLPFR